MELSFMQNELVLSLCWTLVHSLWQGLLLAIITGAVMIGTRKSRSHKRYRLLTFLFFAFVGVTFLTFILEYAGISRANRTAYPSQAIFPDATIPVSGIQAAAPALGFSWLQRFKDYFNTHAAMIVMIWLVIFIARFIRLTANLVYVSRLKHYKTTFPSAKWMIRLEELVAALKIRKKINMLESGIVKVPVVMGVLKPVILLPAGLLAHLPTDEIEAILLHELAHIKRSDYLVNLLQNFAETIFFFNPALMWLSSMLREERENCCDDIAISVTNSKSNFINALIAFQEYNYEGSRFATAFPGRKNQLLNRVKRIVHEKNKTLNAAEKSLLTLAMGVFILFSFAAAKKISPPLQKTLATREIVQKEIVKSAPGSALLRPAEFRHRAEEPTISSREGLVLQPAAPQSIDAGFDEWGMMRDTTPRKTPSFYKSGRMTLSEDAADEITGDRFAGISVRVTPDNNNDVVTECTEKNGTRYKIHSIDGVVKEMYVNGVLVADISPYTELRADLDRAIANRTAHIQEKWQRTRDEQKRAIDEKRSRMERQQFEESSKGERKMVDSNFQSAKEFLFDWKGYARYGEVVRYMDLQAEDMKKKKQQDVKGKTAEDMLRMQKDSIPGKRGILLDRKERSANSAKLQQTADGKIAFVGKNISESGRKLFEKKRTGASEAGKLRESNRFSDSIRRLNRDRQVAMASHKQATLRALQAEDDARLKSAGNTIKDIAADLEKDGVKLDLQKSWFALDRDKFIVDGKAMPKQLHEKFISKYVTSGQGWGYYYGPVKVTGRGVFMDYKNLSK